MRRWADDGLVEVVGRRGRPGGRGLRAHRAADHLPGAARHLGAAARARAAPCCSRAEPMPHRPVAGRPADDGALVALPRPGMRRLRPAAPQQRPARAAAAQRPAELPAARRAAAATPARARRSRCSRCASTALIRTRFVVTAAAPGGGRPRSRRRPGRSCMLGPWLSEDARAKVSRAHVSVALTPQGISVTDLSMNGTAGPARRRRRRRAAAEPRRAHGCSACPTSSSCSPASRSAGSAPCRQQPRPLDPPPSSPTPPRMTFRARATARPPGRAARTCLPRPPTLSVSKIAAV